MTQKTAVVLLNLGGPDKPSSVKPFLYNLFNDPAIIQAPNPIRWGIAKLISSRREKTAQEIYQNLGGGSPLLPNTEAQAQALEGSLGDGHKVFIAMRYWHPRASETVQEVKEYNPDKIVLLPLYPQFSTTTTASSFIEWARVAKKAGLEKPTTKVVEYPRASGFIDALSVLTKAKLDELKTKTSETPRLLLTAHGLPEKIVKGGDPYQRQVEATSQRLIDTLGAYDIDPVICYQSRVGPLKWIGPSTDDEIIRAGEDKKPIVIVSVSFVSEHSETLVELDIEYADLAHEKGVPHYLRVPTVDTNPFFIQSLKELVLSADQVSGQGCAQFVGEKKYCLQDCRCISGKQVPCDAIDQNRGAA